MVQQLRLHVSPAGGKGSTPGQGPRILHAMSYGKPTPSKKKKSDCAGSSALIALVEFDVDDYSYEKLTLDLRGETLLSCVAVV